MRVCMYTYTYMHTYMYAYIRKLTLQVGTSMIHPRSHALCTNTHTEDKDADTQELTLQAASSVILRVSKNSPAPMMLNPEGRGGTGRARVGRGRGAEKVLEAFLIAFGREMLKGPLRYARVKRDLYGDKHQ